MNDYMKTTDRLGKIWVWTAVVVFLMVFGCCGNL